MTTGANVVTSQEISNAELRRVLTEAGVTFGSDNSADYGQVFDGISNVYVQQVGPQDMGYDQQDLERLAGVLLGKPKTFIRLEYDYGSTAIPIVLKLVKELSNRWPMVFDNDLDRIYDSTEIDRLIQNGAF